MKHVLFLRHGPTHAREMIGWTDRPADLSDGAALARIRAALPQAPVVSSDLSRAIDTATAIQATRPRLPHERDLRELHFGAWENRLWADVNAEAPAAIRAFWEAPGDTQAPGGESWNMLARRVSARVDALLADHPTLIVVAHFGAILSQAQRAAGWSPQEAFAYKLEPLSLTEIRREDGRWRLVRLGAQI